MQSIETSFHQDLNGDGTIGPPAPPPPTVIEGFGSTSLTEVGTNFYLYDSGGTGPSLKYQGADYVAGQFGQGGRRLARSRRRAGMWWPGRWQAPISIRSGTPTLTAITSRMLLHPCRERAAALQSIETSFHQDLNGDGTIGPPAPPAPTVIEAFGSTSLTEVGSNFYLYNSGGTGPSLKYQGVRLVAGQFGQVDADWRGADGKRVCGGLEDGRRRSVFGVGHRQ